MIHASIRPKENAHVLVVDDVLMHRKLAGAMLHNGGYKYTCVNGAADAVAAVENGEFSMVLMDVRMPVMDGLEATRQIRALEGPRGQVPIVAMTAQDFPEQLAKCRAAGMDGHLAKPFDEDALFATVGAACSPSQDGSLAIEAGSATIPAAPMLGSDLPILDESVPEWTIAALQPQAFRTLKNQCWAVLHGLRGLLSAGHRHACPGRTCTRRLCWSIRLPAAGVRSSPF
jgi:CheY-like chemotaxis protein